MTASKREGKKLDSYLPQALMRKLYSNSRISISQLVREFGISHNTLSKYLKECERKYKIFYTLDINTNLLGFSEQRIVAVKLENVPEKSKLIKKLRGYPFVQNAYLGTGDFDIILHVVSPDVKSYVGWEYTMRIEFNRYKPVVKVVTLNDFIEGFMPIGKRLIAMSSQINDNEKKLLVLLIENSRMRLKDLVKKSGLSQMKVLYALEKLQKSGVIKKFSICIQNPDKQLFLFSGLSIIPTERHHAIFLKNLLLQIINGEDKNNIATDYSVVCDTSGHFDNITFTCFTTGEAMSSRGPMLIQKLWEEEHPKIEKCILTEVLIGKWPFNSNSYQKWSLDLENLIRGEDSTRKRFNLL